MLSDFDRNTKFSAHMGQPKIFLYFTNSAEKISPNLVKTNIHLDSSDKFFDNILYSLDF